MKTFDDYQLAHDSCKVEGLSDEFPRKELYAIGLSVESNEVLDKILKYHLYSMRSIDVADVMDEMGDVLWYLTALSTEFSLSLEQVAQHNIQKLTQRHKESLDGKRESGLLHLP